MSVQYILINLGLSENFGIIDYPDLLVRSPTFFLLSDASPDSVPFLSFFAPQDLWPVHLYIEHIRVYQPSNAKNVGCDPEGFPTVRPSLAPPSLLHASS